MVLTTSAGRQCKQAGSSTRWCVRAAAKQQDCSNGPSGNANQAGGARPWSAAGAAHHCFRQLCNG